MPIGQHGDFMETINILIFEEDNDLVSAIRDVTENVFDGVGGSTILGLELYKAARNKCPDITVASTPGVWNSGHLNTKVLSFSLDDIVFSRADARTSKEGLTRDEIIYMISHNIEALLSFKRVELPR